MSVSLPISIKGILLDQQRVLLVKNERLVWELPGGRLEPGETPEAALRRELLEELGVQCSVKSIVDAWVFPVFKNREVFIVTYRCECDDLKQIQLSAEHVEYGWFDLKELGSIPLPNGYKRSIERSIQHSALS
ncbi:NUDIX hydrolase [Brevibacillus ginsengisoli]|uniref:NUDIX hydrolase n=1 Tax=Brevibacillus ginsengisoli TaxID=363854 RepID=UPI003CF6EFF4